VDFVCTDSGIFIHQQDYALKVLADANMSECKPSAVPLPPGLSLADDEQSPAFNQHQYCHTVGQLLYLAQTRPDIAYSVSYVSRFMARPQTAHWNAVLQILRYIKGTSGLGIQYKRQQQWPISLTGSTHTASALKCQPFTDADWENCKSSCRSTGGFLFLLAEGAITWSSRRQATVSLSTTDAEYRALVDGAKEAIFLKRLLQELDVFKFSHVPLQCSNDQLLLDISQAHLPTTVDISIQCDNVSAIKLARNPVFHARSKHIELHHHYVRERILHKEISVEYVRTEDQSAEIFTKALAKPSFDKHRATLGLISVQQVQSQH
jgi:hypothetical protein